MNKELLDGEISIFNAVKDLSHEDVEETVKRNARKYDFHIDDKHMDVIHTLVEYYKQECEKNDCHAAFRHMHFLNKTYEEQGGSKYLYQLFDQGSSIGSGGSEVGVITRIHELLELPELTGNVDDGMGTII